MCIRTVPVFAVFKQVDYWNFPPFDVMDPQLRRLHGALVSKRSSPFFQAMLSLVGITFLHPILDGNGRTSRIVFNALIDTDDAYIPLKDIQYLSKGGFTLKFKRAWLHGNWNPVVKFFCSSMDMAELVSKGRALRGSIDGSGAFFYSSLGYGGGKCQPGVTR